MRRPAVLSLLLFLLFGSPQGTSVAAQEIPHLDRAPGSTQLIVGGRPFIVLGGELGNSSAGTAAQADDILPRLARAHINTVLMPVAWEQIESVEGKFDFAISRPLDRASANSTSASCLAVVWQLEERILQLHAGVGEEESKAFCTCGCARWPAFGNTFHAVHRKSGR